MKAKAKVTVYVKKDCGLCGPVLAVVERVKLAHDFDFEKVDITGDTELEARFGLEVPVVTINGRKAFKGKMDEHTFVKKLSKATQEPDAVEAPHSETDAGQIVPTCEYVPPAAFVFLAVVLLVGGVGYFLARGFSKTAVGYAQVTAQLLEVEARDTRPPALVLRTMTGANIDLDTLKDRVVLLNFWATWCPPCVAEMPSISRLYQKLKTEPKFQMLAVSADESWAPVETFFKKGAPEFPVLLDAKGAKAKEFGTTLFPETYVLVNGQVVGFIEGPREWDTWYAETYFRELLKQLN